MLEVAGIELLPQWQSFLAFAIAGLALNVVPGADMAFVAASAARYGKRAGVVAALGIGTGALTHIAAAVLGLSALIASSQTAFSILKYVGAAYLLYLAVGFLLPGKAGPEATERTDPTPTRADHRALFRSAMLINILNPKVGMFFLAFLPQFVDPQTAFPALQILFLGLWFDLVGTLVNCIVALVAAGASARLRDVPWLGRAARYVAATAMGGLAVQLALSRR